MIVIKKEYKEILNTLGAYDQYMDNVTKQSKECGLSEEEVSRHLSLINNFISFLSQSFFWADTPEENPFWFEVAQKGGALENKV